MANEPATKEPAAVHSEYAFVVRASAGGPARTES